MHGRAARVPDEMHFATKTQIPLAQLRTLLAEGAPHHCVLADAGYGVDTGFRQALSGAAHQRWRIERDYQDLTQDFGLGHYEGRSWRGFHHHASLSIAACGFR